ncbi:MAG TPA: 4-alpha-glucanotransferase, partial [Bryobacteraceae bacterium]|nr:4-alpha-glucanotransferase [Bryobacteraceae bacterium]
DLLGILALESARGNFIVVGEDLGTVAPGARHRLAENGVLSYRLLWFEKQDFPEQSAVSITTHDLPTLAGFYAARDIEARRAAHMIDEEEYARQIEHRKTEIAKLDETLARAGFAGDPLGFALATPSRIAIVNQEDLTGETEQQNVPGTTWQHPNWRRKMKIAVEELGPLAQRLREKIIFSKR